MARTDPDPAAMAAAPKPISRQRMILLFMVMLTTAAGNTAMQSVMPSIGTELGVAASKDGHQNSAPGVSATATAGSSRWSAQSWFRSWIAIPIWTLSGAGIGLIMPIVSVLVLEMSPEAEQGSNSAAIQLADMAGSVVGIATVAVLVNRLGLHHLTAAVSVGDAVLAAVALLGALMAARVASRP